MIRSLALSFVLFSIVACTGPQPEEIGPTISQNPPIRFAVVEVVLENEVSVSTEQEYFARRRNERLIERTEEFLNQRFEAAGGVGWARILINEATLDEIPQETTGGVQGTFTRESDRIIDAKLGVRVAIMDEFGVEQAFADARVERQRGVLQRTSVVTREAEVDRVIADLLKQLDDALTRAVDENLNQFRAS